MADTLTVSSKYQIVIPKSIRARVPLQPGQKLVALVKHGQITLVPVRPLEELVGVLKGIDPTGLREEEDRI